MRRLSHGRCVQLCIARGIARHPSIHPFLLNQILRLDPVVGQAFPVLEATHAAELHKRL